MSKELRRLPIIKLWDRIVVPIQGEITDELAGQLSQEILREIHQSGAHGLVLDLTGVWIMDSHLCSVLSNLASAARLMGTPTIISGLSPEIAMTLQTMGVELESVQTALTLEQALAMLGLDVHRAEDDADDDDEPAARSRALEDALARDARDARGGRDVRDALDRRGPADAYDASDARRRRLRFADT
jgi:rsbT antagonist protein RsbS